MLISVISKNRLKEFGAFKQAKYRKAEQVFSVEGAKMAEELLRSDCEVLAVCASKEWIEENNDKLFSVKEVYIASEKDLERITNFTTPSQVWALAKLPETNSAIPQPRGKLILALDRIKDPGNLGTIIRIADWFGIEDLVCSHETVDAYNPKCLQATMGSIFRINVHHTDLYTYCSQLSPGAEIYGALLEGGINIYEQKLGKEGMIIIGNESNGISQPLQKLITNKIFIPRFGNISDSQPDSLNAAISTAIVCSEFRRINN